MHINLLNLLKQLQDWLTDSCFLFQIMEQKLYQQNIPLKFDNKRLHTFYDFIEKVEKVE